MDVIYSLEGVGCESRGGGEDTILAWVQLPSLAELCLQIVYIPRQFIFPARSGEKHLMVMT